LSEREREREREMAAPSRPSELSDDFMTIPCSDSDTAINAAAANYYATYCATFDAFFPAPWLAREKGEKKKRERERERKKK